MDKLFHGLKDWNFGLFIQEIFKQELEEKDECVKKCLDELDEELDSYDAKSFESVLNSAFPDMSQDKMETTVQATFDHNLSKIINKIEIKRKLQFMDIVGMCK